MKLEHCGNWYSGSCIGSACRICGKVRITIEWESGHRDVRLVAPSEVFSEAKLATDVGASVSWSE